LDPGGQERPPRGKAADRVRRPRDLVLPNDRKIWPGAEINEGGRPKEINGIPAGFYVPK
jgi:hypothetical protein